MDSQTKVINSVVATPPNVHDSVCLPELLHGEEARVWGDSAYQGQSEVIRKHAPKATDFTNRRYRFHAKVPLVPLLRLAHLSGSRRLSLLGGGRGADDGGIDNRAGADLDALALQAPMYLLEQFLAQPMALQQMAEAQHRGLIGHRHFPKVRGRSPAEGA